MDFIWLKHEAMTPTSDSSKASERVTPDRIMRYSFAYAAPLILEAAVDVGAFDALEGGPRSLDQVAAATRASRRGLRALLNALVGLELLTKDDAGCYALTPDSAKYLVRSAPGYLGGFLRHASTQLIPRWLHLTEAVRTGRPTAAVNQEGEGSVFFEKFVEDLFPLNYPVAKALGEALNVGQAQRPVHVLDLAAGSGVWGIALARLSPQVRVTAVDWPGVLPVTKRIAERHGVADRFRFVAGDLLAAEFGSGYDIATLGHILHSEGERRSRELLNKVFAALAPGGTVAIAEWLVSADRREPVRGLIFAVNMLVNTDDGDTFSFEEMREWLLAAGFGQVCTLDVPGPTPLVLATKPGS
jgi:SAM-dependent methyltransferase